MNIVEELYSAIEDGRQEKNLGLGTGLPKLDWYTGGFQKSVYRLVFGQSGSGKSSFVIYNIYRVLKDNPNRNIKQVYFSLEMSSKVLLAKLLGLYLFDTFNIEISFMKLMSIRAPLTDVEYGYVQQGRAWLESISDKLIIYDKQLNAPMFYAIMRELLASWGTFYTSDDGRRELYKQTDESQIVNIIIDHAGLLTPTQGRKKKEEIDLTSAYCVAFREKCCVSIDFIMQENRNASDMNRRKMDLSESTLDDVKDTGNAVNDCNICIAVYSPLKYQLTTYRGYRVIGNNEANLGSALRGLILLKHRFGSAGKVFCSGFQGSIGRFVELPDPDNIDYEIFQAWKDDRREDNSQQAVQEDAPSEGPSNFTYSF